MSLASDKPPVCVMPEINECVLEQGKRGKGYNVLEKELGLTKKQANRYASKWEKEMKAERKHIKKRRTPYP